MMFLSGSVPPWPVGGVEGAPATPAGYTTTSDARFRVPFFAPLEAS